MYAHIATKLSGLMMYVVSDTLPSVTQRSVPLPSVLRSDKVAQRRRT